MLKQSTFFFVLLASSISSFTTADPIAAQSSIPYSADARVAQNIRNECTKLGTQLAQFTQQFGKKFDVEVQLTDTLDTAAKGRVLQLEITEAVSMGNAFIGHQKYATSRGTLFENGEKIASFEARRQSMGGAFAGYKGSCSVLGRTVKAMGKDIAQWLKEPTDKAMLGDM
jgi:hypothetical protein